MSAYVLKGGVRGHYVARPGEDKSYTPLLQKARVFATRAEAERERCGNETVISVENALEGRIG